MPMIRFEHSGQTYPVIERTDEENVDKDLQDVITDFAYKVYGVETGLLSVVKGANMTQIPILRSELSALAQRTLAELQEIPSYSYSASRLAIVSVSLEQSSSSGVTSHVALAVDGNTDDPILINNPFGTRLI